MDSFLIYILLVNIVAFLAFVLDFLLCSRFPRLEDTVGNSLVMGLFPIIGGALGSLAGLFVCTGFMRRHRINKDNIAWWFVSFFFLAVWAVVTLVVCGVVDADISGSALLSGWNMGVLRGIGIYAIIINAVTLVAFIADKRVAERGNDYRRRIPEARLLGLCLIGGSIGGIIGMYAAHHKTKKWYFVWGLPAFLVLDIALVFFLHSTSLI